MAAECWKLDHAFLSRVSSSRIKIISHAPQSRSQEPRKHQRWRALQQLTALLCNINYAFEKTAGYYFIA